MNTDIEFLQHPRSVKRRSAARRLRKLGDVEAGPTLLAALEKEVQDVRTWETQYQLVMAIGECKYAPALPFLENFANQPLDATMIYIGLGDALVRLQVQSLTDGAPVLELMNSNNLMLIDGAFRAMAMLRMVPPPDQIETIISFTASFPMDHKIRFWPLAASPGWDGACVSDFILECSQSGEQKLEYGAKLASDGKYGKWKPL